MTLINLYPTTLNADGSTTLFGAQGNAIEQLYSGSATTIFAAPPASAVTAVIPITYAPAPFGQYFQTLLTNPQLFQTIGDIKVFKMYMALDWPDATLTAFFAYCAANNVALGVEAPALVANPGTSDAGIEGFAGPGSMLAAMQRISSLGGTISYVSWDEPFFYGSTVTSTYTMAQAATQVAAAGAAVKAIFPNVKIVDTEPVDPKMDSPATLKAWFAAYSLASGSQFSSFLADTNTEVLGWQSNLAATIAVATADGIPVGEIDTANGAAPNNAAWASMAVANGLEMLSDPATRPNYIDVQSWQIYPSETPDPTLAGTMASVAADIQAGESAALAVPAMASYANYGILQSVTWTGGCSVVANGTNLTFTSAAGTVVAQFAWSAVRIFAFNPNTASVSLTVGTTAYAVSVTSGSFVFASGASTSGASSTALTLTLAAASTTGLAGSSVTHQSTPTLTGTAAANSTVQLQVDGSSVGTAVASATGAWTFAITAPLATGAHLIQATGGAAAGAASQKSLYVVSVDPTQHLWSTIGLAPGSDTGYAGDNITDATKPVFAGADDANVQISVSVDGKLAGSTTTDANGNWACAPASPLALGLHTVSVSAAGPPGTSIAAMLMQVTIDTAAQETANIVSDPLFDAAWYLQQHPGIATSAAAAYAQYMATGWKQGFDPSPFFSTSYYLQAYPDVAAAAENPLTQFETAGWQAGRNPSSSFNTAAYEAATPGLPAGEDPLVAYIASLTVGAAASVAAAPVSVAKAALASDTTLVAADNNVVAATPESLASGVSIGGGSGNNSLLLEGGGLFNLALPASVAGIQSVSAQEGQGATAQTVVLRAGLKVTVNVAADTSGDFAPGVTIVGAANRDVINLGPGNDSVTLAGGETVNGGGGTAVITLTGRNETVNGGTGNNTIIVTAPGLTEAINGGGGTDTLVLAAGGTAVMGDTITGISDVRLAATTTFKANGSANLLIAGSAAGGDSITLGAASQSVVAGGVNEQVMATASNAAAQVSGLGAGSELEITSGGDVALNSATGGTAGDYLTVKLDAATNLTLSSIGFIHAVGSSGGDTITAGASDQTLTGGTGSDTLVGYAGGYDTFQDTKAGLGGVTIENFVSTDVIDITNLVPGSATLTATASQGATAVSVASGAGNVSFLMAGSFSQSGFALTSDGAGGTIVTHT